jgi:nitroimidazol reductase NimA-like FMN-containing flavoprotein (pyridoxamine 5'-phosphate oxidase superfamily)
MSYVYEGDSLYGFSTDGLKNQWMRANPKVCFEVDEIGDRLHWASIVVTGLYREIADTPQNVKERARAQEVLRSRSLWWNPALSFRRLKTAGPVAVIFYVIKIEAMSGYRTVEDRTPGAHGEGNDEATFVRPF